MTDSPKNLPLFQKTEAHCFTEPCTPEKSNLLHETHAYDIGYRFIAGVDEAGRGPLAGPVVASAVILPFDIKLPGVTDSKKMTSKAREKAFIEIKEKALATAIAVVSAEYIDRHNILNASLEAMKQAVMSLDPLPELLLVDGIHKIPIKMDQKCLIKGDRISLSISAASVLAKVYRDHLMLSYHEKYPVYGFDRHKGYGTARHMEAIKIYGPTPIHRRSFKGVV